MSSKKRSIKDEHRVIQEKWKNLYFFCDINGKPTCLICNQQIAVPKEYNVRRHYDKNHAQVYKKYSGKARDDKVEELEQSQKQQQSLFKNVRHVSDAAVKASYIISNEIAASSRPFTEGDFVKKCMLLTADVICPDKRQAFANVSLSRNTIAERINEIAEDIDNQLQSKVKSFVAFSVAIDESTDVCDVAQLAVFIRGVDENMQVTEEFVELVPMKGTTKSDDIFASLVGALDKLGVDWKKCVSLATDGAPQMVGRKAGVVAKLQEKLEALNPDNQFRNIHCIIHREVLCSKTLNMAHVMDVVVSTVNFIRARGLNHRQFNCFLEESENPRGLPYHTDVRWLSRGTVLKRFFELRCEIQIFMGEKGKEMHELNDNVWLKDLAFMVDITDHLNHLNIQMQGKNKLVTEFYDLIRAFEVKLQLFQRQIAAHNLAHFPNLKSMQNENVDDGDLAEKYCEKISKLRDEFKNRFSDFKCMENEFAVFRNPFSVDVNVLPEPLQLEIIDMQCDSLLKDKFSSCQLSTFYQYVDSKYPKVKYLAQKIMSMYGSTFACEQLFSIMNINKSRLRSKLSDEHLNSILKIAAAQSFTPNFDAMVKKKRSQVSGSSSSQH